MYFTNGKCSRLECYAELGRFTILFAKSNRACWHIFSNLSMDRAKGISRLQYFEMLHTWAYLWEKNYVQRKRHNQSQEYSSTLKILRICVATDTGSWYFMLDTSKHSTCTFVHSPHPYHYWIINKSSNFHVPTYRAKKKRFNVMSMLMKSSCFISY